MKNTKLIAELNSLIGTGRTKLNATLADAIMEVRLMHAQVDRLQRRNQMLRDAVELALKAMDGGFADTVDYAQWDSIRSGLIEQLEIV